MELATTPEDEFEVYFQKAAKHKDLVRTQHTDDAVARRGSLPTEVRSIHIEVTGPDEKHHHRASSCKTSNKINCVQMQQPSSSSSVSSTKRHSYCETIQQTGPGNGFLSLLSTAGETTVPSSSAPQSRSGSFRKTERRGSIKDLQETDGEGGGGGGGGAGASGQRRRSSVYLEETVAAKLRELKEMEDENCLVVRQFTMSPKGDIINRVDSFKKKREPSPLPNAASSSSAQSKSALLQVPGQQFRFPEKSQKLSRLVSCEKAHKVLVIGDRRVGKTALMTQFMTSEYLAALDTSFDGDTANEKSISVSVDGEEVTLQFTDLEPEEQQEHLNLHPEVECYLLVYSIADRKSFAHISSLLEELKEMKRTFAIIVVANKSDVVRKRQVSDSDAMDVCEKFSAKYIEVSAALNHKVDELLVGIVNQIRLNPKRRQRLEGGSNSLDEPPTPTSAPCSRGAFSFLSRLFSKKKSEPRPCADLQTI